MGTTAKVKKGFVGRKPVAQRQIGFEIGHSQSYMAALLRYLAVEGAQVKCLEMIRGKKSSGRGGRFFPEIIYEVVDDPSTDSIISWSQSGKSFIVWNESEFCREFLPRYFQLKEMSSFIIRLLTYGFTRVVESEQHWEYANDCFVRGKPELTAPQSFVLTRAPEISRLMERQKKRVLAWRKSGQI